MSFPTFVDLWRVGNPSPERYDFTTEDVSAHLLDDWCPWLPVAVGSSFMGWPPYLLSGPAPWAATRLSLIEQARGSERQWKSVLSWMLGVAGARHYLERDLYRWIAPVSAFYQDAVVGVSTQSWDLPFPKPDLSVRRLKNRVLAPDFLAARSTSSAGIDWAVVEAKGTHLNISNKPQCPADWKGQVDNIEVRVDGRPLTIPRRLVIATRVNPNAKRPSSRAIQVRAWNQQKHSEGSEDAQIAILDIVSAHLFGLFRNLQLDENAQAISLGLQQRRAFRTPKFEIGESERRNAAERAVAELKRRSTPVSDDLIIRLQAIDDRPSPTVRLNRPLLILAETLQSSTSLQHAMAVLRKVDRELDSWWTSVSNRREGAQRPLPVGAEVQFSPK